MNSLKFSALLFICLFCIGCSQKTVDEKYNAFNEELQLFHQTDLNKKEVTRVIFINDVGCPNCILSFSNYVLNNFEKYRNNSLIFINSTGKNVDMEQFLQLNAPNVIISHKRREDGKIIPNLGIAYIKENTKEIDTIILIHPRIIVALR